MADAPLVDDRRRHQSAGRAGLHALAAGDAGARPHRVVHVEHDLRADVAVRHADHVVDLDLAAGAHAEIAVDAGVQVHRHRGVAEVGRRASRAPGSASRVRPCAPPTATAWTSGWWATVALGLIGEQQLHDHAPRGPGPVRSGHHLHAGRRLADAGCREHALALDLDHAGAAVAIGAIAGLGQPAQVRDDGALALGDLPDGLAGPRLDLAAVEREGDGIGHDGLTRPELQKEVEQPGTRAQSPSST